LGVSNHWTGIWPGTVEWSMECTMEFLCAADGTILLSAPASFVPFHSVRPRRASFIAVKITSYVQNMSIEVY